MPSLGIGEIILFAIVVILFVQPKDLPKFFKNLGGIYSEIQRNLAKFKYYTRDTLDAISNDMESNDKAKKMIEPDLKQPDTLTESRKSDDSDFN